MLFGEFGGEDLYVYWSTKGAKFKRKYQEKFWHAYSSWVLLSQILIFLKPYISINAVYAYSIPQEKRTK
jgi:hypothetical protein